MENLIQKQKREKRDKEIRKIYPALTLRGIANIYGISPERARQIIDKGREKLSTKLK